MRGGFFGVTLLLLDVGYVLAKLLVVLLKGKLCARILLILIVVAGIVNITLALAGFIAFAYQADHLVL